MIASPQYPTRVGCIGENPAQIRRKPCELWWLAGGVLSNADLDGIGLKAKDRKSSLGPYGITVGTARRSSVDPCPIQVMGSSQSSNAPHTAFGVGGMGNYVVPYSPPKRPILGPFLFRTPCRVPGPSAHFPELRWHQMAHLLVGNQSGSIE